MAPFNLPPGCTYAELDRAVGADAELPCAAQSPDGSLACDRAPEHQGDHEVHAMVRTWTQVPACANPNCPNDWPQTADGPEWPVACDHDFPSGAWVEAADYGGETFVVVARWPQREDDFDEETGVPTDRKAKVPA